MLDWKPLLTTWSKWVLKSESGQIQPPPESPDWLGFPPASESEIAELENRLGVILPPSYKSFLQTTNGFRRINPFIDRIRPASEVNWLAAENEHLIEIYTPHTSDFSDEEYYDYEGRGKMEIRGEHFKTLIQISDDYDGFLLLNPEAVTPDGEWEAWFFANWVPGAERFPSFAHLMIDQFPAFDEVEKAAARSINLPKLKMPSPHLPRVAVERVRKIMPRAPEIEALLGRMKSPDQAIRNKAVTSAVGKLRGRPTGNRRPDLVSPLCTLFYDSTDPQVRGYCVQALTEFAEEGSVPNCLFDALSDPEVGVILSGISALHYFPHPAAWKPLCKFIDSDAHPAFKQNAIAILMISGDSRAVPTLQRALLDISHNFDQIFGLAGTALARCGNPGFEALLSVINHADRRVRLGAVIGLDISGNPAAVPHLDRMKSDPDPKVAQRAKIRMGSSPFDLFKPPPK